MMKEQFKDLEDYGIIGNLETCALVGVDGSIDWLCFPYLESPSVFGALLDLDRGGLFRIRPTEKYKSIQSYIGDTNVLKTVFHSSLGIASITDFMPIKTLEDTAFKTTLFRKVEWLEKGELELEIDFMPRFNYGRSIPKFERVREGVVATWRDQIVFFHSPVPLDLDRDGAHAVIRAKEGRALWFVIQYNNNQPLPEREYEAFRERTLDYWEKWSDNCRKGDCVFEAPWHNLVIRSGLILKLLSNTDNGAIAAAATTSLPESIGGVRNWDYRFSWIRDAAFTAQALYHIGHDQEARAFRDWVRGIINNTREMSHIRVLYPLRGETSVEEADLDLQGYRNSRPVRTGNKAAEQTQLDIYGELLNAIYETTRYGEDIPEANWPTLKGIVEYVSDAWKKKDSGIWEDRTPPKDYVYSKLMCWVAVDRGIKIAEIKKFDAPIDQWRQTRDEIRQVILEKGFSRKLNSFIRSFGSEKLDATGLLIPVNGFLPFNDPRVQGTIDAIMKHLMDEEGLVARYNADDGLPGKEGKFILCSFWLVMVLAASGRQEEAERIFTQVLRYMSPLGLIAEEIDPDTGKLLGNMPQAFSQIGLINAALHIGIGRGRKHLGPKPMGQEHEQKQEARVKAA